MATDYAGWRKWGGAQTKRRGAGRRGAPVDEGMAPVDEGSSVEEPTIYLGSVEEPTAMKESGIRRHCDLQPGVRY